MNNIITFLYGFTYRGNREKKLENFRQEVSRIGGLSEDEIVFELTEAQVEKEYWKSPVAITKLVILCAVLFAAWAGFVSFVKTGIACTAEIGEAAVIIAFWCGLPVAAGVSAVILYVLHGMSRDYRENTWKLMMLESAAKNILH